jgi:hypothetical protein
MRRLRGRSFTELRVRGAQFLLTHAERLEMALRSEAATRGTRDGLELRRFGPADHPRDLAGIIAREDPLLLDAFRARTAALHEGHVDLLGLGNVTAGNPPDWHRDPGSGLISPRVHWSRIPYLDPAVVGDHKTLWEVNRHQYLFAPAFLWLVEGQERDFRLVENHLESWLAENPPRLGVNWASSLEVGYRAITWCWLMSMLCDAPWRPGLKTALLTSLEAHALHVERYLSTYFSPNTHLTGEALALFYVGSLLQGSSHAARLRARGAGILEQELSRQVYPDGVYFEQASLYHRYTAEIYFHYALIARSTGWQASATVPIVMRRLFEVLRTLMDGSGRVPMLGDDDGGLLLPLDCRAPDELAGLQLAAAAWLDCPHLRAANASPPALAIWMCGESGWRQMRDRPVELPAWNSLHFTDGGLAVLRDGWDASCAMAVVDAGRHGAMNCGHAHADALACTLSLGTCALFIDRGTFTYVGAERDAYRATSAHNTLEIDGEPSVQPRGPFHWGTLPSRPHGRLRIADDFSFLEASAQGHVGTGHAGTDRPSRHERTLCHVRGGAWVCFDRGERAEARRGTLRWQLAPGLSVRARDAHCAHIVDAEGLEVAGMAMSGEYLVRGRDVSPRFGARVQAPLIEIETGPALQCLTLVVPARSGVIPVIQRTTLEGVPGWEWEDSTGRHFVLLPAGKGCQIEGLNIECDLIWGIRPGAAGGPERGRLRLAIVNPRNLSGGNIENLVTSTAAFSGGVLLAGSSAEGWANLPLIEANRGQESS